MFTCPLSWGWGVGGLESQHDLDSRGRPTSGCLLLCLLSDHRRGQVDGEGEGRLLGVLDDYAGIADAGRDLVLLLCDELKVEET